MRALVAYLNGQPVGTIGEDNNLWTFEYDPAWVAAPASFDLSPWLPRAARRIEDGSSDRPVQQYFDNLLPEEGQRTAVSKAAKLSGDDSFALLEYLGLESAGSLVLLPPGKPLPAEGGLQLLTDAELSRRIRARPRVPLSTGAPKRMSVAGAQDKLLVVYRPGAISEPFGNEPSTHILKPDHLGEDYPSSVGNEFFTMTLARRLGLDTAPVLRHYVPEPVYIVARLDRYRDPAGATQRRHIIDACQLLNKSRLFKYSGARLETLADIVQRCRNRARARLGLYRWLLFNVLIGGHDNHLKNLSFLVGPEGIDLAPAYDLLSTAAYRTLVYAKERANWPDVDLGIALPGAQTFAAVSRESVLAAGEVLGLPRQTGARELERMSRNLMPEMDRLETEIRAENSSGRHPAAARSYFAGELRLVSVIRKIVAHEMVAHVAS